MAKRAKKTEKNDKFDAELNRLIEAWREQIRQECSDDRIDRLKDRVMQKLAEPKTPYDADFHDSDDPSLP